MQILGIQILGMLAAIFILFETRKLHLSGKFPLKDLCVWYLLAASLLLISSNPLFFQRFLENTINLQRALDAYIILGLFGVYLLLYKLHIRIEETNRAITDLVQKIAIKFKKLPKD
jgi:hypothetical protein